MTEYVKQEIKKCVDKIRSYPQGFEFTLYYNRMSMGQYNAINIVTKKAEEEGLIKSISIGLSLEDIRGESDRSCSDETYVRL